MKLKMFKLRLKGRKKKKKKKSRSCTSRIQILFHVLGQKVLYGMLSVTQQRLIRNSSTRKRLRQATTNFPLIFSLDTAQSSGVSATHCGESESFRFLNSHHGSINSPYLQPKPCQTSLKAKNTVQLEGGNSLTKSKAFERFSNWAFERCDTKRTGDISMNDLYSGVLLMHLCIARLLGPVACYVSS